MIGNKYKPMIKKLDLKFQYQYIIFSEHKQCKKSYRIYHTMNQVYLFLYHI